MKVTAKDKSREDSLQAIIPHENSRQLQLDATA